MNEPIVEAQGREQPEHEGNEIPALALTGIHKRFGDTVALDDTSFTLRTGTVHALLGENGAGKTTLMRIAFGLLTPERGTLAVAGTMRRFATPRDAIDAGIGMVHQHFMLIPNMTVTENIALGGHGRYDAKHVAQRIRDVGERHGLSVDPDAEVGTLPVSARQRVEILKALVREARILILDEPTAVLAPQEARTLLSAMREFVAQGGSVVLITHKLRDALEFADDITVLRRGRVVYAGNAKDANEQTLATAMLGRTETLPAAPPLDAELGTLPPHDRLLQRSRTPIFTLRDTTIADTQGTIKLANVSLDLHAGEIVGIAAVEGNGQHELLRVLANRQSAHEGHVERPPVVGFIPEDRHQDALILDFPLFENVALAGVGTKRGTMDWGAERETTAGIVNGYDVRASGAASPARVLSGGNQQKLVVGREMTVAPAAIVAENPTRGLDIHATSAVHERLRNAANDGAAVVVYSSDLDEVLALATRIIVLYGGQLHDVPNDRERVGNAMIGR